MPARTSPLLPAALLLSLAGLVGCAGGGDGNITGQLFLRGCDAQGLGGPPPDQAVAFSLDPTYFAALPIRQVQRPDINPYDVERMVVDLKRTAYRPERTDHLRLVFYDVEGLQRLVGQTVPLTPPDLTRPGAPLPTTVGPAVDAALVLAWSCPYLRVQPSLRGTLQLVELGFEYDEWIEARLAVDVEDQRSARAGLPLAQHDATGHLVGWFRFQIRPSRAIVYP